MTKVFGAIIEARLSASRPDSFIVHMLETRHRMLEWWESRACKYLTIIDSPEDAICNLQSDLLGDARASNRAKFDGRLKDTLAELCTVVELSLRGGTDFKRIQPPLSPRQKAPDFECLLKSDTGDPSRIVLRLRTFAHQLESSMFSRLYMTRGRRVIRRSSLVPSNFLTSGTIR